MYPCLCVARRSARWGMVFSALVTFLMFGWAESALAGGAYKGELRIPPRAIRYRYDDDSFAHQESAVSMVSRSRNGGDHCYTGNRLTQFTYVGPPGKGGMYEAMKDHKAQRPLDPKNYQYRMRY